jgi:hypothetical protein
VLRKTVSILSVTLIRLGLFVVFVGVSPLPVWGEEIAPGDRPGFLQPLFRQPYEYMFETGGQKVISLNGRSLTPFLGGIRGLVYYFSLRDCFAAKLGLNLDSLDFYDLSSISRVARLPLYLKEEGPESPFSYVNPLIVKWGYENLIPAPADQMYGKTCQEIYTVVFHRFFRLMGEAYLLLDETDDWATEAQAWQKEMANHGFEALEFQEKRYEGFLPEYAVDRNGSFMTPAMALSFWIRRHLDGSASEVWTGLSRLLTQYDDQWFQGVKALHVPKPRRE